MSESFKIKVVTVEHVGWHVRLNQETTLPVGLVVAFGFTTHDTDANTAQYDEGFFLLSPSIDSQDWYRHGVGDYRVTAP